MNTGECTHLSLITLDDLWTAKSLNIKPRTNTSKTHYLRSHTFIIIGSFCTEFTQQQMRADVVLEVIIRPCYDVNNKWTSADLPVTAIKTSTEHERERENRMSVRHSSPNSVVLYQSFWMYSQQTKEAEDTNRKTLSECSGKVINKRPSSKVNRTLVWSYLALNSVNHTFSPDMKISKWCAISNPLNFFGHFWGKLCEQLWPVG